MSMLALLLCRSNIFLSSSFSKNFAGPIECPELVETCHDTTRACLETLKAEGFRVYVCDLDEDALAPEAVPVDKPIALVFGSELQGVTPAARALADGVVSVPMRGFAESLNVSVAAALTLRPICERRRAIVGEGDLTSEQQIALFCGWVERDVQAKTNARKRHGL